MEPPWSKYPEWPAGHIAWRMGVGEGYLGNWVDWVMALNQSARREFLLGLRPVPGGWVLFVSEVYAMPATDKTHLDDAFELFDSRPVEG